MLHYLASRYRASLSDTVPRPLKDLGTSTAWNEKKPHHAEEATMAHLFAAAQQEARNPLLGLGLCFAEQVGWMKGPGVATGFANRLLRKVDLGLARATCM